MPELTNILRFNITREDIKTILSYLAIDVEVNHDVIMKVIKFGNYIQKIEIEK